MVEHLFSYGTLQSEKVQLDLFGRSLKGTKDRLTGYTTVTIEITDEVFLARGDGAQQLTAAKSANINDYIEGTVFEVSDAELIHADRYEPANYVRVKIELASGTQAWIYLVK